MHHTFEVAGEFPFALLSMSSVCASVLRLTKSHSNPEKCGVAPAAAERVGGAAAGGPAGQHGVLTSAVRQAPAALPRLCAPGVYPAYAPC